MGVSTKLLMAVLKAAGPYPTKLVVNSAQFVDPSSKNLTTDTQFRLTLSEEFGSYDFKVAWGDGSEDHVTCSLAGIPVITPGVVVPGASTVGGSIDVRNGTTATGPVVITMPSFVRPM